MSRRALPLLPLLPLLIVFAIVAVSTAIMLTIRFYIVEPETLAAQCAAHAPGWREWRCMVRDAAVFGFLHNVFGWTALLAGVFATLVRWRGLALLALLAGVAGAVLYTFELSGAGLLLGALAWVHRPPVTDEQGYDKQRA